MADGTQRVLIVGRSERVLVDAVAMLRGRGFGANGTNQFERVLDDYDATEVDLVIFGGMVPAELKERLGAELRRLNPDVGIRQGLGGIAPLLVAQAEEFFSGGAPGIEYDSDERACRLTLEQAAPVIVDGLWAEYGPTGPSARSLRIHDGELGPGGHEITVPVQVPEEGSHLAVRIGSRVSAFPIGEVPRAVKQAVGAQAPPTPEPVATQFAW